MGKKYIEEFVLNTMTLEEILHKIKVEENDSYYYELLRDIDVRRIVDQITNRYSYQNRGFLISKDVVKGIVETELMLLTWRNFKIWLCAQDNIKNGYLAFIYKYLPLRVGREINKERPGYKSSRQIVNEYFDEKDINENGDYKETYQYCEILVGDIYDLEIISDRRQESRWNSTYGQDFRIIEENDKFEELFEDLTDNQRYVLRKVYKDKYTERELAEEKGISQQCIHKAKRRALNHMRRRFGI